MDRYATTALVAVTTPSVGIGRHATQEPPAESRDYRDNNRGIGDDKHRSYVRLPAHVADVPLPSNISPLFQAAVTNVSYDHMCRFVPHSLSQLIAI